MALQYLLGFYDGDGNYRGGYSARILNTKKVFLEEIKEIFEIPNKVVLNAKEKVDTKTGTIIWKARFQLSLGKDLFKQMLYSKRTSLKRKRPKIN